MNSSEKPHGLRARSMRSPSVTRRNSDSVSVIASSAVARVSTSGVLATTIPCARHASRSTLLTPTP